MNKILVLVVIVAAFSVAASVKEWKNFENGKVYSHKTMNEKKQVKTHGAHRGPVVEERLLHSHHRDKKAHHQLKENQLQTPEKKEVRSKNAERHHKKNIEEDLHLKPLNERHHKFPNPALLNKIDESNPPSPQISKQKLIKQAKNGRLNNRRRLRGRRYKRNKSVRKQQVLQDQNLHIKSENKMVHSTNENLTAKSQTAHSFMKQTKTGDTHKTHMKEYQQKLPSYW